MAIICRLFGHRWSTHTASICQREPSAHAEWRTVHYTDCERCNARKAVERDKGKWLEHIVMPMHRPSR